MAGATSHKLGVDLTIIWVGDVGGKREGRGKRVGCNYQNLTDHPDPDFNPRLVTAKRWGLSSSAVCECSHRWKNTPKLSEKPGWVGGGDFGGGGWNSTTEQIRTCTPPRPCLLPVSPSNLTTVTSTDTQQGMNTPPHTRPLHNTCLSRAYVINTKTNVPPYYLWKQRWGWWWWVIIIFSSIHKNLMAKDKCWQL